jgi:uncharacterized membrane protein YkoI
MPNFLKLDLFCTAILGLLAATTSAPAYADQQPAQQPTISVDEARGIALRAFSGIAGDAKLEPQKGGSGLRYSFDVRQHSHEDGTVWEEVDVDANTGKVIETKPEPGPHLHLR